MALPFLDAMLPPLRAAAKPAHRFQAFYVPNGMAMEYWTPKGEGAGLRTLAHHGTAGAYKDQMLVLSGIKASWNYIHAGASGIVSHRHAARRQERNRNHRRRLHRSTARPALRAGNAAGVARNVDGPARQRGRLHRQSELRLSRHALLAQPHAAAAHGMESAHGFREAVRR